MGTVRAQTPDSTGGYGALPPSIASNTSPAVARLAPAITSVKLCARRQIQLLRRVSAPDGPLQYEFSFFRVGSVHPDQAVVMTCRFHADRCLHWWRRQVAVLQQCGDRRLGLGTWRRGHYQSIQRRSADSSNNLDPPAAAGTPATSVAFGQNGIPGVTVREVNRTFMNLGGGKEMYLIGSAHCDGLTWRIGWDGGGHYGSERVTFNEIPHRTGVIEGAYAALHSDIEIPWGTSAWRRPVSSCRVRLFLERHLAGPKQSAHAGHQYLVQYWDSVLRTTPCRLPEVTTPANDSQPRPPAQVGGGPEKTRCHIAG